ncbi:MAG TPA: TetR/AcrR family transcriptional regulator [Burkholderiales bacterium]|nr:TetR/AcrR family transcriptional regulator [Burkholderiales bacterium]
MARRSKGEETRTAILDQAVEVASRVGLEGLTIGSLADATGMSKSGLFAHFGSREDLQLAALEHVKTSFGEEVLGPVLKVDRGLPRLRALFQSWLDWKASPGPGGCVLQSAAHEYDDRPGRIRDSVVDGQRQALAMIERAVRLAMQEGHLRAETDPAQIAFEMYGQILVSHNHRRLLGDREARKRALLAFDELVARYTPLPQRQRAAA